MNLTAIHFFFFKLLSESENFLVKFLIRNIVIICKLLTQGYREYMNEKNIMIKRERERERVIVPEQKKTTTK